MGYRGFIFDVDGVLVDSPHEMAWGKTLERFMQGPWSDIVEQTTWTPEGYTTEVYQSNTAGKARAEGAKGLFRYFQIPDPDGNRLREFCDAKQKMIVELIVNGEFEAFDDALRFIARAKQTGALLAAASSSKNADMMLSQVRPFHDGPPLIEWFDANVCGRDFQQGKPHPEIFLTAAFELGLAPEACVVIEDAPSGVVAAKTAGMACIGIARLDDRDLLQKRAADWVVESLDLLQISDDQEIFYL